MTQPERPRLTFIPDILEEHVEELSGLARQREDVLYGADAAIRHLKETDQRIVAHLDGVRAVGEAAIPMLSHLADSDDVDMVDATTMSLLTVGTPPAIDHVLRPWSTAATPGLLGAARALRRAPEPSALAALVAALDHESPLARVLAARCLARAGRWRPSEADTLESLTDPSAAVREQGWLLARETAVHFEAHTYANALRDEATGVRDTALVTAAWSSVQGTLRVARQLASSPSRSSAVPLFMLAVLGERQDVGLVTALARDTSLGVVRFALAGLAGFPALVPDLLDAMSADDPRDAIAAGRAFTRITGTQIDSDRRVWFPREGADPHDPLDTEFEDDGLLPDLTRAVQAWEQLSPRVAGAQRVCAGRQVDKPLQFEALPSHDMAARWWQLIRSRFWGATDIAVAEVERFPCRLGSDD